LFDRQGMKKQKEEKSHFQIHPQDNEDEIIKFYVVCSSLLRGFLVEERKKDSIVRRLSGLIFNLEIVF